ncbi:type II toxin-antitoxin system VapC family toxin [Fluviispira multicolorata]|uniref:PIN domain-containing protein n=1 Tax=Fluviispira multicolorata TaxID=2654512 RepID=A0A833JFA9_9BACT|nr:type II toxin-antitoxin system VapC family toxin [Fluviispira multicolorata]KAB8033616.1 PIN domain-containing protein [Fluviispira multicolorata]
MKILLDTQIIIWILEDSDKLSKKARKILDNADEVFISSVSVWEMMIKMNLGKLDIEIDDLKSIFKKTNFIELPLKFDHILSLNGLPDIHRDPFDRMLVAQALSEPLRLITADALVKKYSDLVELV